MTESTDRIIHVSFTIGPVQRFVAQARRTRDLWAGSWLLSYLAESALAAAEQGGGNAMIPYRREEDQRRVTATQSPVGGMPNRFELVFDGPDAKHQAVQAAEAAKDAFRRAWSRVARAVFDAFLPDDVRQLGNDTRAIWQRQVDKFWELSWVVGQPDNGAQTIGRLAAMRKNFRNVQADEEPGVKCSLMPTLQELSGHRAGEQQRAFWQMLRKKGGTLDIGESERLCAIALIKRLFPKVMKQAVGEDISPELDQVAWPSTAFMAAIPWLESLEDDARQAAEAYQQRMLSNEVGYQKSEWQAARDVGVDWAVADGPIWFAGAVRNDEPGREKLGPNPSDDEKSKRKAEVAKLLEELRGVYQTVGATGGATKSSDPQRPVPYYALLLMDGDSVGKLSGRLRSPEALSRCLGRFAGGVRDIVASHNGRTVYAGGDDVLALLPAASALQAADDLRQAYAAAFGNEKAAKDVATISAAVVYAHWRYPLRQVLRMAHHLLDDVAKDRTGRDAIAVGVILGSGLNAVWSVPWDVFHGTARTANNDPCVCLLGVLNRFQSIEVEDSRNPPFNASFLYLLRQRFGHLLGESREQPGEFLHVSGSGNGTSFDTSDLLRDLAHAEYRRRMKKSVRAETKEDQTRPVIDKLMSLSRRWRRKRTGNGTDPPTEITCDRNAFGFDGWRVARFLKQIKDGKADDHD